MPIVPLVPVNMNFWALQDQAVGWGFTDIWQSMSLPGRGVIIVLTVMLALTACVMVDRTLRFGAARNQSRIFVRQSALAFHDHQIDEVITAARQNHQSHVAMIAVSGLTSVISSPPRSCHEEIIEAARRDMDRSAATTRAELKCGLTGLATIASIAPFIGLFGTVLGIMNAFGPFSGSKSAMLAHITGRISEALASTAMGLLTAVPAVFCYNYLSGRMDLFETEMKNASSELVSYLMGWLEWNTRVQIYSGVGGEAAVLKVAASEDDQQAWDASDAAQILVLLTVWLFWLFFVFDLVRRAYWW